MRYRITVVAMLVLVACATTFAESGTKTEASGEKPKVIELFNGKDFTGWKLFIPDENVDPATVWEVRDGVVHCNGNPAGYMRTTKEHENYRLKLEWRWPARGGNSGVLLHIHEPDKVWPKSIEGQLASGHAADFWVIDGTDFKEHTNKDDRRVLKRKKSNEKPLGEWNQYEIFCKDNVIRLHVNGLLQNVATDTTVNKGYIGLQSEGAPIQFRNITLEPLN